jgi:hypothetical protein
MANDNQNNFNIKKYGKELSKMTTLALVKVSMTVIAIFIYLWFFCLIALLYIGYNLTIHKLIRYFLPPIYNLLHYTIGGGSVLWPIVFVFDKIIFNSALGKFYGIAFGCLTILILVIFAFWILLQNIFILKWVTKLWPFDELVEVFKIIMYESPFSSFAFLNLQRLFILFSDLFKKKKEKFDNKLDMASIPRLPFETQIIYITELEKNLYDKAKQHYEEKETYMVDVMKVREHTTDANILKNLSIITSEKDITSVNIANSATTFDVNIQIATKL